MLSLKVKNGLYILGLLVIIQVIYYSATNITLEGSALKDKIPSKFKAQNNDSDTKNTITQSDEDENCSNENEDYSNIGCNGFY